MEYCRMCGIVDSEYDEDADGIHEATPKHQFNKILYEYKEKKKSFWGNKEGVEVCATVAEKGIENTSVARIIVNAKLNETVKYMFNVKNTSKKDMKVVGIGLAHHIQPEFTMNDHDMRFGEVPFLFKSKTSIPKEVVVTFKVSELGQHAMPIVFTFTSIDKTKLIVIIREMVVNVADNDVEQITYKNKYDDTPWRRAETFLPCLVRVSSRDTFKVPAPYKKLFPAGLQENAIAHLRITDDDERMGLRAILVDTRATLDEGLTKANYPMYWHYLLWWEETILRINLRKYNMGKVTMDVRGEMYILDVPGLAEKRPSLLRGDKVLVRPCEDPEVVMEGVIKEIEESLIHIDGLDLAMEDYYTPEAKFDIHFMFSRIPMERMHCAVNGLFESNQAARVFPVPNRNIPRLVNINKFHNKLIQDNTEQVLAVRHILSNTSGRAPYMVFGPPGTGKTITIVEAIIQLVLRDPKNRIMVCTDSNMAADHVACTLLQYKHVLGEEHMSKFLFRPNSQNRSWESMPSMLMPYSNGHSYKTFYPVSDSYLCNYRVVVATLQHSYKYGKIGRESVTKMVISHLFIDEAAQSMEPACLIPIVGLLGQHGTLVLAGDPQQLGPVCLSRKAKDRGLGKSLMERLKSDYRMYDNNPNYITMLKKNFRSHPDILKLPNQLFYHEELQPAAPLDKLSNTTILKEFPKGEGAVVYHGVNSKEQRVGRSPSYFNDKEQLMVQKYVKALITEHNVNPDDIGIIAPYIRQVYKIKSWLTKEKYNTVEVGTVEAFQGKEKRVIIVSTVRADNRLLDNDAKYGLGFLVDDKRFNVALTRAKAKAIIIGNTACLIRDKKFRLYIGMCEDLNSRLGMETEQLPRTIDLLRLVAVDNFDKYRITEYMRLCRGYEEENDKKNEDKKKIKKKKNP